MSQRLPDHLRLLLLPYDPLTVGEYCIGPEQVLLPRVRCTEDRPADDFRLIDAQPPATYDHPARVAVPSRPDAKDFWTPQGMAANAARTGLSATGGLSGLVVAHTVAAVMDGTPAQNLPPVNTLAVVFDHIYPGFADNHEHCLGREKAPQVLGFAVAQPDKTLQAARETAPWISGDRFQQFLDAAEKVLACETIFPPAAAGISTRLRPLKGTAEDPEAPPAHAAEFIVAIGNTAGAGVLWDTNEAWRLGTPGYALNTGYLPTIFELVNGSIGGKPDTQTEATIYFQGAATHLLPQPTGKPLTIFYEGPGA